MGTLDDIQRKWLQQLGGLVGATPTMSNIVKAVAAG